VRALSGGGFLIVARGHARVWAVTPDGILIRVAGTTNAGGGGDGGPATSAELAAPTHVSPTADGGFLIADHSNGRIRRSPAPTRPRHRNLHQAAARSAVAARCPRRC
jgi:hypothetical protein